MDTVGSLTLLGARPTQVEVVAAHHDWLDYLAAAAGLAGIVGAIVAIFAVIIAKRAAADAKVQREAVEEEMGERRRRANPVIAVHAREEPSRPPFEPRQVVLTIGLRNLGDRPIEHMALNFLIPASLGWRRADQYGEASGEGKVSHTPERLEGDQGRGANYWDLENVGRLVPHSSGGLLVFYAPGDRPASGDLRPQGRSHAGRTSGRSSAPLVAHGHSAARAECPPMWSRSSRRARAPRAGCG